MSKNLVLTKKKTDRLAELNHHLSEVGLIEHRIKVLKQQEITLSKELNAHYVEIGVLERELGIYCPDEMIEKGDGENEL